MNYPNRLCGAGSHSFAVVYRLLESVHFFSNEFLHILHCAFPMQLMNRLAIQPQNSVALLLTRVTLGHSNKNNWRII
ncbi:hypothetical protein SAMN05216578_1232 [Halopseudomonas formosensis]|uniref:Uncharacterized protein n=1 Tax=Halopseudomonas formosensis TaxID=1002526 RepID=A0A1I6C9T0_9GAMM|nr:hypothetical protein SAMN05216578_1232 [Halopseudomonas formosensis]